MNDPKKRIRWTIEERRTLAVRLSEVLRAEPHLSKLQAMDRAQTVLPAARRRHLAAWSTVREFIEPYMPAVVPSSAGSMDADTDGDGTAAGASAGENAEAAEHEAADGTASPQLALPVSQPDGALADLQLGDLGLPAGDADAATAEPPDAIEAALLRALSSPRVADKLAAVFASAMSRALEQAQAGSSVSATVPRAGAGPTPSSVASPRPKVLIAGISPADALHLGEAMRNKLDLRFWRQGDSREQLRLHGRACSVAVVMSEAVDSDVEALLRSMQLRVVRHTYNASRLEERLNEMQDHGMFNLLI